MSEGKGEVVGMKKKQLELESRIYETYYHHYERAYKRWRNIAMKYKAQVKTLQERGTKK